MEPRPGPRRKGPRRIAAVLLFLLLLLGGTWTGVAPPEAGTDPLPFHGNVTTKKFHKPTCRYYNCKNCLKKFATREEALAAGYQPCQVCKP